MLGQPYTIDIKYIDNNIVKIILGEITVDNKGYFKGVFIKGLTKQTIHNVQGIFSIIEDMISMTAFEYPTQKDGKSITYYVNKIIPEYCNIPKHEGIYTGGKYPDTIIVDTKARKKIKAEDMSLEKLPYTVVGFCCDGLKTELTIRKSYFN